MIREKYLEMLNSKSVIREIAYYGIERAEKIGKENVFDYSIGNPSVPAPSFFNEAIAKILREESPMKLHGYAPAHGFTSTRKVVANSLNKRFSMNYNYNNIFMTNGAASSIAHSIRAVVKPGEEIIIFAPYFPEYIPYISETGAITKIVPPDVSSFQINFTAFEEMLNANVAAVLINSPNNPSGIVYSSDTIKKLADLLQAKGLEYGRPIYLISDEPYREIVFEETDSPFISQYYKNTLQCYSFSKSLSIPGERIGYIAVNPLCENADVLADIFVQISRGIGHNGPSTLLQLAVEKNIDKTARLEIYAENEKLLYAALVNSGYYCVEPGGTFYMFPRSLEADANAFCKKALAHDILLVPGDSFGCPGHFRIAFCVETEKLVRSLPLFEKLAKEYA